jgi:tetratricopeptide (TPR) repeat protein
MSKMRLDSWKSIAEYLDRSRRTVQRWHAEHGLPVHHFGGTQGCVFAYTQDLDAWLSGIGQPADHSLPAQQPAGDGKKRTASELASAADEMWTARSERNLATIAGLYRQALDVDPSNPSALIGLANAMISAAILDTVESSVAYLSAAEALRRVPQDDARQLDAKCGAAFLKMAFERKWRQARVDFDCVLAQFPEHPYALVGRSLLHVAEAELPDASRLAWEAWRQNPLVSEPSALLCWIQYLSGNPTEALDLMTEIHASGATGATFAIVQALALTQIGPTALNLREIEDLAEQFPQSRTLLGVLGCAYALSCQTEKARLILKSLEEMCERKKKSCGYALALVLVGLGRRPEAIQWLEAAYQQGSLWSLGFRSDPMLRTLDADPRFESLLKKIGSQPEPQAIGPAPLWVRDPMPQSSWQ